VSKRHWLPECHGLALRDFYWMRAAVGSANGLTLKMLNRFSYQQTT
jgi:hypothetical protein